ncbi:MAG TPA: protein kinase [Polyangiaceae bacterium]|nr:protein kinase [Polyangiaceae bacterium]
MSSRAGARLGSIGAMLSAGEVFAGRYRVLERIAQGGMGVIYEAEHLATEERVALKVLFPQVLASKAAVESFQLEARMTARIGGEHVVRILDAGFDERRDLPYLAMELLRGATLRSLVANRGPLSAEQTVAVVRQVAKALDKAHGYVDRGGRPAPIVHRDLKPENIFVALREGAAVVKLLDFGIAKVLSESTEQSREVRGTPAFMAYEQFAKGPVTPRLDVWALGLIVFYLLTGRRYWLATARGGGDFVSLLGEILTQPFAAPTERARALGVEPAWPRAFDEWFSRCVNRDLAARFDSAGAAAAALEPALLLGARLSKAEAGAARGALARLVAGLLSPANTAAADEGTHDLTGSSADDSALDVTSAQAHPYVPPERTPSSPWADASPPRRVEALPPGSRAGATRDAPNARAALPSLVETSSGLDSPADAFAPTALGLALPTVRDPEPPPAAPASTTAPAEAPPAAAFLPPAARGTSPSSAAFDPTWSSTNSTNSTKTLRLGTLASNLGRELGALRVFRRPMLWAAAASVAFGCFGSLLVFSLLDGLSKGRPGVALTSAPLSAPPKVAVASADAAPASPPAPASAPPPSVPTPTPPPATPLAQASATTFFTPAAVPAQPAAPKPLPAALAPSARAASSAGPSAGSEKGPEAGTSKKAMPHDPSQEKQGAPQPDKRPEPTEAKKGEAADRAGGADGPPREPPRSPTEGKVDVRPEAPTAPSASPKSMYERL